MNEEHFKELMWEIIPPPAMVSSGVTIGVRNALAAASRSGLPGAGTGKSGSTGMKPPAGDLMIMGFPTRLSQGGQSLCACHGSVKRGGYLCPRCGSKMCDVPTDCEVCGLMVVSSPHLARRWVVLNSWSYTLGWLRIELELTKSDHP